MASSLINNTVTFILPLSLPWTTPKTVAMFEALVASGLNGFLGCMSDIFETALVEFYQNASVRDGKVISSVQGKSVEIFEEVFARTFQLPVDGLTDLNEWEMKIEFRLLSDILAKSIFVKAGSFDAVTHERFLMMEAINGGVNINWSREVQDLELGGFKVFPPLKILSVRTFNRYIAINDKISVEDVEGVADESRVKKTPMEKAVSKKRPATAVNEPIAKKKRTRVGKAAKSSAIVTVAQEAIPLQIVEPIRAVPAVLPSKPKRKAPKRRLKFPVESDDEIVEEETAVGGIAEKESMPARADVVDKEISTTDDVDHIIEQVIAETAQFETDVGGTIVGETNVEDQAVQRTDEMEHWFNVSYEEFVAREADRMVETGSDADEEIVADKVTGTDVDNHRFGMVTTLYSFCSILDQHPDSPPTSADSSLHFNANDISTGVDLANDQLILTSTAIDISASLSTLRESISRLISNQTRDSRKSGDAHEEVMSKINRVERVLLDSLAVQNQAFRGLIKSIRQEAHIDNDVLSIALKAVRAQNAILSTDLADARQEVKDLKAELSKDFDDKLSIIHNDLLEFRVETQGQLASLGTNLAELISFITKGSDDKKGEVSSSHGRGQPPPDNQDRPSGGSASSSGGDGSSRRRDDIRGSSTKRGSSGGGGGSGTTGGPYKKNVEWWLYGKNQF
ncbi:hypothetical protein F511_35895 [Dorcoceras hygrometricum]|uniref:Uncharacterized protein n=1 Tax=Dorcoceras hygrometricum TaxID=472368 RepID=A0A2Z7CBD7_9LAMI|nr:hypothetical protein F511_35895 [Dorcoceras hygrometricum]